MAVSDDVACWRELADDLKALGAALYTEADLMPSEYGAADPKVLALTLLCRTMGNFQGALLMLTEGLVVEARTLVRCEIENLMWIDGIATKGTEFIKEVVEDEFKSKLTRGRDVLEWLKGHGNSPELEERLGTFLEDTKEAFPKPKRINFRELANAGSMRQVYVFYGNLSSDSAHPSAASLSRHVVSDESESTTTVVGTPDPDEAEILETLEYGCMGLLGVCVGTNQIIGGLPSGSQLEPLFQRYQGLQKGNHEATPTER